MMTMMKKWFSQLLLLALSVSIALPAYAATGTEPPVIPAGDFTAYEPEFTEGQTYAVYSAPSSKSLRGGKERAKVSTNDWIQVFGSEGDWIFVQYAISTEQYRTGYIYRNALDKDAVVPELQWDKQSAILNYDVDVTDDPLISQTKLASLKTNDLVTCLASMGNWTYIECTSGKQTYRGFVPTEAISKTVTTPDEACYVLIGDWRLYAGSVFGAMEMSFRSDGTMVGTSVSEYGDTVEWYGNWNIEPYDTARKRYWNDPEFELVITRSNDVQLFGLRICKEVRDNGMTRYALVLSDGNESSGMVLCE